MQRELRRRTLLGAGLGAGLSLLTGCSALPPLPGLGGGGGTSMAELFSAIDPAIWGEETGSITFRDDPLTQPLELTFTRPRAIGELFEVADDLEPVTSRVEIREHVPLATRPALFTLGTSTGPDEQSSPLSSNRYLFAPEVAVLASQSVRQAGLWRGVDSDLFDELEEHLSLPGPSGEDLYTRDGRRLLPTEELPLRGDGQPLVVEQDGEDLRFHQEVETPKFDGEGSAADLFVDLQEMLDAVDLPEAHVALATSKVWSPPGAEVPGAPLGVDGILEWHFATELTSPTEHTTRGVLRLREDRFEDLQESIREGGERHRQLAPLRAVETERISEQLLLVTLDSDHTFPDPVEAFYNAHTSAPWPNIPFW